MINKNFSKMASFISELRKEKKLTQKDLAEQLGVTDKAVSKWERGLSCPDISLLPSLSHVLGVTPNELLNGERAEPSAPERKNMNKTPLQVNNSPKNGKIKNKSWKTISEFFVILLLSFLVFIGCNSVIEKGLTWSLIPLNITVFIWLLGISGAFIMGKNKVGSLLLCGFCVFITTFYYSALNQTPVRDISSFNGFPKAFIPHYNIILLMIIVSSILAVFVFLTRKEKSTGDKLFSLMAGSITLMILSLLTISAIMDYVDLNFLGVDQRFTILILLTILINMVLLVLLVKKHKSQNT